MTEQDILDLIRRDEWMMRVLRAAEELDLPDWVIGAGFVRNKVWDHLHGYSRPEVDTADIDLVYMDRDNTEEEREGVRQDIEGEGGRGLVVQESSQNARSPRPGTI